jgi:hypothetical protein
LQWTFFLVSRFFFRFLKVLGLAMVLLFNIALLIKFFIFNIVFFIKLLLNKFFSLELFIFGTLRLH